MINVKLKRYPSISSDHGAETVCGVCGATCVFTRMSGSYPNKECWACKTLLINPLKLVDHQFERVKYHSRE